MRRLAIVFAVLVSGLAVLATGSARAADGGSSSDLPGEVRGMIVLKVPFGGPKASSAPRLGFDFQMQQKSDYDHLKESYDSQTGRRLPEIDTGRMRTWQFDPPEFLLPDEQQGRPDPIEPGGGRPELG
jgi:hypothetical protein